MKSLEYMLHHALVTAMQPDAQVLFVFDSFPEANEAFWKLRDAGLLMNFKASTLFKRLEHEKGGRLAVHAVDPDYLGNSFSGVVASHVYSRSRNYKVNSYMETRIRTTKKFETESGLYGEAGAHIWKDY